MSPSREVDAADFRRSMEPTIAALVALAKAVEGAGPRHGNLPAAESQAMGELAREAAYRARSAWENPISDTHTFGAMTLWAAADYVRTFAAAFVGAERPPLYGHLPVARAALEAGVVSSWLNEPGIAYEERIRRGLCERLYSAREVKRLRLLPDGEQRLAEVEAWATSFGWRFRFDGRKPSVAGSKRPAVDEGITRLLMDNPDAELGRLQWGGLSAVNHVVWWGLTWALDLENAQGDGSGFATVSVGTESTKVAIQALCILKALRIAATRRFTLMGWSDAEWQAACSAAEEREGVLLRAAQQHT